ncbi:MAG TPA: MarR family winged helix-turn-helix transcriptional regulator [Candidatus Acidoferrum sp.]|nr:MarR family winged helix-turn-helix transcriptional regulator [Candidatus Acidoferrum sp.]
MDGETVQKIRRFNRYYTVWLEVMNRRYLGTILPWTEARVIFEVYMRPGISATEVCGNLGLDKSYVSRILSKFEKRGFLAREPVPGAKGLKKLTLTGAGRKVAAEIDQNGSRQIAEKLSALDEATGRKLSDAMAFIEETLRKNDRGEVQKHGK